MGGHESGDSVNLAEDIAAHAHAHKNTQPVLSATFGPKAIEQQQRDSV